MPKMKTRRSMRSRYKVSARGKVKRRRPGARHLMSGKSGKQKRQLRRVAGVGKAEAAIVRRALQL